MTANLMGGDGIIVLIVALVVLVGGSQLPKIARNVGLAGKEFRKAQAESEEEHSRRKPPAQVEAATPPPPVALPATPQAGAASSAPLATSTSTASAPPSAEESITLTPAQLEALLKAREEQVRNQPQPGAN